VSRGSPESRTASLPVRAFYSVAELARAGNVPTYRLLRLLRRNGVTFLRSGRAFYVTIDEIRTRIPPLWNSLRVAEELRDARPDPILSRRAGCPGAGGRRDRSD
jgi:hypothetical protein